MGYILPINHNQDRQYRFRTENRQTGLQSVNPTIKAEKIRLHPRKASHYDSDLPKRRKEPPKGNRFDVYI